MESVYLTFKDKYYLFFALTSKPKYIEEVILHEDPITTWMEETFHKIERQSKYWRWIIRSLFSSILTHFHYDFEVSQWFSSLVCTSSIACPTWVHFIVIGDVIPCPFTFQAPITSTILSILCMQKSHSLIELHTWFHWNFRVIDLGHLMVRLGR